jgi:hypothetical protein
MIYSTGSEGKANHHPYVESISNMMDVINIDSIEPTVQSHQQRITLQDTHTKKGKKTCPFSLLLVA